MWKALILSALALVPSQAFALRLQCNYFEAQGMPSIRLEEYADAYRVTWDRYTQLYNKAIDKRFGVLVETGYAKVGNVIESHVFRRDNISGIEVMIVDSIVFVPVCKGNRPTGPNKVLKQNNLWILSPQRWP